MTTKLTNRIVGSLALLAIAVIVLPELLSGKPQPVLEQAEEIPLAPAMRVQGEAQLAAGQSQLADAQQQLPAQVERSAADDEPLPDMAMQEAEAGAKEPVNVKPPVVVREVAADKPSAQPLPGHVDAAYAVQLGVFSNAANVAALAKKVQTAGYKVYTIPARPVDGKPTRVLVGPHADKAAAERLLVPLADLTGVSGRVVVYDPLSR